MKRGLPAKKVDPTPGDVGRFSLHMDAKLFARQLVTWCGNDFEINDVAQWFEDVAANREARANL